MYLIHLQCILSVAASEKPHAAPSDTQYCPPSRHPLNHLRQSPTSKKETTQAVRKNYKDL